MLGRFTANACDFYDKLGDLVTVQQRFSEKNFGPARERDARGPLDHLKKECDELAELVADPNHNTRDVMPEVADLFILLLDVWWRLGVKASQVVDAAVEKMKENEAREWPTYQSWTPGVCCRDDPWNGTGPYHQEVLQGETRIVGNGNSPLEALEDAYRQIRDLNCRAVENVREPQKKGICPYCGSNAFVNNWGKGNAWCSGCDKEFNVNRYDLTATGTPVD